MSTIRKVCVQECIDPSLIGATKFDLRIYVLVESVIPLTAHICRSAMLRKCMEVFFHIYVSSLCCVAFPVLTQHVSTCFYPSLAAKLGISAEPKNIRGNERTFLIC